MDGLKATAVRRQHEQLTHIHTPVLALTANAMKGDRERCLAAGMDGYVSKPRNPRELFEAIGRARNGPAASPAMVSRYNCASRGPDSFSVGRWDHLWGVARGLPSREGRAIR